MTIEIKYKKSGEIKVFGGVDYADIFTDRVVIRDAYRVFAVTVPFEEIEIRERKE